VPWRARDFVHCQLRRRASRPQLKRDPLGSGTMPLSTWHVGKLVLVWVICILGLWLSMVFALDQTDEARTEDQARAAWKADDRLMHKFIDSLGISADSLRARLVHQIVTNEEQIPLSIRDRVRTLSVHPSRPPHAPHLFLQRVLFVLAAVLAVTPFVVSWRWFGAREAS
jgi:hypothetical protein